MAASFPWVLLGRMEQGGNLSSWPRREARAGREEEEDADEVLGPRGRSVKDIEGGQEGGQESCEGSSHLLSWNLSNEIIP